MKAPEKLETCPSCGVKVGELHQSSCDAERCPFCGQQMSQDKCVTDPPFWEINYRGRAHSSPHHIITSNTMTDEEILTKAFQKVVTNGWGVNVPKGSTIKLWARDDTYGTDVIAIRGSKEKVIYNFYTPYEFIFNHDFAKALWGKGPIAFDPKPFTVINAEDEQEEWTAYQRSLPAYQYHLMQMVIADKPIKYLGGKLMSKKRLKLPCSVCPFTLTATEDDKPGDICPWCKRGILLHPKEKPKK